MSERSISGFVPFVSSFTLKPRLFISRIRSGRSGWRVGSPPLMQTPSSLPALESRKASSSSVEILRPPCPKAREPLWQKGQRILQPPVKTVQAI